MMNDDALQEPILIALSSDNNGIPGLVATMTSLILSTDKNQRLDFHLLDAGMSAQRREHITAFFAAYPNVTVSFHRVDVSVFEKIGAPSFEGGVWSPYARLFLYTLIPDKKCLYFDTDFLVLKDVREIWATNLEGIAFAACVDMTKGGVTNPGRLDTYCELEPAEILSQFPYYNSGFLLINLDFWRDFMFIEKAIALCKQHGKRIGLHDQGLLNYIFRGKTKTLPLEWNYMPWWTRPAIRNANYHLTSKWKPWGLGSFQPVGKIWWALYDNHIKPRWDVAVETQKKMKGLRIWLKEYGIPCLAPEFYCFLRKAFKNDPPNFRKYSPALLKAIRKTVFCGPDAETKETIAFYKEKFRRGSS